MLPRFNIGKCIAKFGIFICSQNEVLQYK